MIVVVPMAGRGKRFSDQGVDRPKPFIEVAGRPMVAWAFESVAHVPHSKVVFVALAEHVRQYELHRLAGTLAPGRFEIVELDEVTEGQLCTVLAARESLETDEDVLIASADTVVESNLGEDILHRPHDCRGLISVARLPGDQWSFAAVDDTGRLTRVAEKERISPLASTGLYYFANGREFLAAAGDIIASRSKTRGEYYVIPVYQRYVDAGKYVGVSEARDVWDMGTPDALRIFEQHLASQGSS